MFSRIFRKGLPLAVALGLVLPFVGAIAQTDQPKAEKNAKAKDKGKGKGKSKAGKRKAEQPKAQ